ncbi:MAG: hypothetical protein Q4E91_12955 [Lachnospiraceae bacterium]|nr:hypothetical protein [Lachnospiraceae bacterium]
MKINFEYVTNLQYEVKALRTKLKMYESGEAYRRQQETYEKRLKEKDCIIASLKKELAESHLETVTVRNNWMQVFDDMEKEHKKALSREQHKNVRMENRALKAERDQWHDKWSRKQAEVYSALTELEEEKQKNCRLTAQVNRNFENSSIPSSVSHGKIRTLLSELTGGEITLSDGLINSLGREFSEKTGAEKQEIIRKLMYSPVMNADFTNANVNVKSAQVLVLASPLNNVSLYIGKEKRGTKA